MSRRWAAVGAWALLILAATSLPGPVLPEGPPGGDKLAHLLMYGVLGALIANASGREQRHRSLLLLFLISVGLSGGFGAFDEWHQQYFGRNTDVRDWLADVAGAAAGAGLVMLYRRRRQRGATMSEARKIKADELAAELAKAGVCVVELWMQGCPSCARFAPTYDELAGEYDGRANFVAMDAREDMAITRQYGIKGVPTVIVFKDGQEVQRTTGAKTLAEMREWLDPALD